MTALLPHTPPLKAIAGIVAGLLALLTSPLPTALAETPTHHFTINQGAHSLSPETAGIQLNVYSGTLTDNELTLYVGFKNAGTTLRKSFGLLTRTDYALYQGDKLTPVFANSLANNINLMMPDNGILPGLTNAGSVHYNLNSPAGPFKFRVAGFAPIEFDPATAPTLTPVPSTTAPLNLEPNEVLTNTRDNLAVVRLHVLGLAVLPGGEIQCDIAFENAAHRDLTFASQLSGYDCYLIDAHQALRRPVAVSDSLSQNIGPKNGHWPAGTMHKGWVRYQVDSPHALQSLAFSFPEFNSLVAKFDESQNTYNFSIQSRPGHETATANSPLVAASEIFHELSIFFQALNNRLNERQYEAFLSPFSPTTGARQAMSDFLVLVGKVPVHNLQFRLPKEQDLRPNSQGHLEELVVYMHYNVADISPSLIAKFRAKMARDNDSSSWIINELIPDRLLPFWVLGYNGTRNTDHFLLFYRPDSVSDDKIGKAARQVEKAYQSLSKIKGLRLAPRYPAFFIDRQDDFAHITGRDPSRVTGAVSAITETDGDRFVVMSGGLYINDFNFLSPSNTWGASERESTITHELVHLALSPYTRPFMPLWVVEGTAVHFADQNNSFTRQALKNSGVLGSLNLAQLTRAVSTNTSVIGSLGGDKNYYMFSGEIVSYLIRTYGEERFLDFYRAFADYTPSQLRQISETELGQDKMSPLKYPLLGYHLTQKLVRNHFNTTLEEIDSQVKAYIYRKAL
ncbi:MAG: hypothetical protein AAF591_22015 [Verrucomicrobiota bacterium]